MKDGMTARKAAAMHGVPISSVWDWCHANPVWLGQYEEARGALYRHWEEDIVEISDEQHVGQIVKDKMLGREIETRDMTDHRRLRVESRKWLLSKLKARQYGDKLALGGADDLPPIQSKADVTLAPEDAYKQMIGIGGNGRT
jgi:hypothetical protein